MRRLTGTIADWRLRMRWMSGGGGMNETSSAASKGMERQKMKKENVCSMLDVERETDRLPEWSIRGSKISWMSGIEGQGDEGKLEGLIWKKIGAGDSHTERKSNRDLRIYWQLKPKHSRDRALKCHQPLLDEFVSLQSRRALALHVTTHMTKAIEKSSCLDLRGNWLRKTGWTVELWLQLVPFPNGGGL